MKQSISKNRIKEILTEELKAIAKEKKYLLDPRQDDPLGYKDLRSLSSGIVEKKRERVPNASVGNPYHDEQGRFCDPLGSAGSWSLVNAPSTPGRQSGQAKRPNASRVQQFTNIRCGRGEKVRCKDGSAKWESVQRSDLDSMIVEELLHVLQVHANQAGIDIVEEGQRKEQIVKLCSQLGLSFPAFLRKLDLINKSQQGDLLPARD